MAATQSVRPEGVEPRGQGARTGPKKILAGGDLVLAPMDAGSPAPEGVQEEEMEVVEDMEEESEEMQQPRQVPTPDVPTEAEVRAHEASGHVQFRSWCPCCCAGRGKGYYHKSRKGDDLPLPCVVPKISVDYCFMSEATGDRRKGATTTKVEDVSQAILVLWDDSLKYLAATTVPAKGIQDSYSTKWGVETITSLGHAKIVVQSDDESSIKAWKDSVVKMVSTTIIPAESTPHDHQAQGAVERHVGILKDQIRTMAHAMESSFKKKIDKKNPLWSWLPSHAAAVICRYKVGPDGRTPETRRTGRPWNRPGLEFGERLWVRVAKDGRVKRDWESRMQEAHFVGYHRSKALLALTKDGLIVGVGAKRQTVTDRWRTDLIESLQGVPWNRKGALEKPLEVESAAVRDDPPLQRVVTADRVERKLYVVKKDIEKFGATDGCPGCACIAIGGKAMVQHNDECRTRIEELLQQEEVSGKSRRRKYSTVLLPSKVMKKDESKEDAGSPAPQDPGSASHPVPMGVDGSVSPSRHSQGDAMDDAVNRKRKLPEPSAGGPALDPGEQSAPSVPMEVSRGLKRAAEERAEDVEEMVNPRRWGPQQLVPPTPTTNTSSSSTTTAQASSSSSASSAPMSVSPNEASSVEVAGSSAPHAMLAIYKEAGRMTLADSVVDAMRKQGIEVRRSEVDDIVNMCIRIGVLDEQGRTGYVMNLDRLINVEGKKLEERIRQEDPVMVTATITNGVAKALRKLRVSAAAVESGQSERTKSLVQICRSRREAGKNFCLKIPFGDGLQAAEMQELLQEDGVVMVDGPKTRWTVRETEHVASKMMYITNCKFTEAELRQNDKRSEIQQMQMLLTDQIEFQRNMFSGVRSWLHHKGELCELQEAVGGPVPEHAVLEEIDRWAEFIDHITGVPLDSVLVRAARELEIDWIRRMNIWQDSSLDECKSVTGKMPLSLRWIDTNKRDQENPEYRSRLVVREIKARKKVEERLDPALLFSGMPPAESLRMLVSYMQSEDDSDHSAGSSALDRKMAGWDISRAHFYGDVQRPLFVQLPQQPGESRPEVKRLLKTMYGTQDASHVWQGHYTQTLKDAGFEPGLASNALFFHPQRGIRCLVHGDDFLAVANDEGLKYLDSVLQKAYALKRLGTLGDGPGEDQELSFLNRIVRLTKDDEGRRMIEIHADPRHSELVVQQLGLDKAKGADVPSRKMTAADVEAPLIPLTMEENSLFRSALMRCAYLSQDRPDIQEAVKSLSRWMVKPNQLAMQELKRLGRYLKKVPYVVQEFKLQRLPKVIRVYVDSDHAGDLWSRKSTTGMVTMVGLHTLRQTSNLQSTVSLSSGESEYYALVKGAAFGLSCQSMYRDFGIYMDVEVLSDSSAARSFASRRGLGKQRHVHTRYLWIQERVANKDLKITKVGTHVNISDLLTKTLSVKVREQHLRTMGFRRFSECLAKRKAVQSQFATTTTTMTKKST